MTYWLSVVRFVPDPARGEFINVAAIAGNDTNGDWKVRAVSNWKRAKLIDPEDVLGAVANFIGTLQSQLEDEEVQAGALSVVALQRMSEEMRNVVQVSSPIP